MGETGPRAERDLRRRRSNRPGNSQAKGLRARALWKAGARGLAAPHRRSKPRGAARAVNLSGSRTEGASASAIAAAAASNRPELPVSDHSQTAAPADAALRAARRARRPHGAVRRLRDAGAVPDRHHRRASAHARAGRAVRCLAHGPGCGSTAPARRRRSRRWCPATSQALARAHALHAASPTRRRHPRRSDGDEPRRSPLHLVVNAACKDDDLAHLQRALEPAVRVDAAARARAAGAAGAGGRGGARAAGARRRGDAAS